VFLGVPYREEMVRSDVDLETRVPRQDQHHASNLKQSDGEEEFGGLHPRERKSGNRKGR